MPGADTVTVTLLAVVEMNPGIVALTVVDPPLIGSKAMPPAATLVGELDRPAGIVTVRLCAEPADVVSCATALVLLVIVAVRLAPGRTFCVSARFVLPPVGIPTRTQNAVLAESEVVLVPRFSTRSAGCTVVAEPVPSVNPGADAVIVTPPVAPSTPSM